ncbi:ribonuclease P protein component [Arthrobacter sp. MWB30]|nr:ribonuclease P protein component [Arthrobacter sp. MWB30]
MVRALPAAANASWEQLLSDYNAALAVTTKRLSGSVPRNASTEHNGTTTEGTPRA